MAMMLNLIYEDKDVLLINKQARISMHPSPHDPGELTLVTQILEQWPEIRGVGEDALRPGIVHRLDKETSGALVVAKNQRAFEHLKAQFQSQSVIKTYIALVLGKMSSREGKEHSTIGRSRKFGKFTTRVSRGTAREAVTRWRVIREYKTQPIGFSPRLEATNERERAVVAKDIGKQKLRGSSSFLTLLDVTPETGRTHQIRVHLAEKGHPVIGDALYGGKVAKAYRQALGRHFLHAFSIEFILPSGGRAKFEADLPEELTCFLEGLSVVPDHHINKRGD